MFHVGGNNTFRVYPSHPGFSYAKLWHVSANSNDIDEMTRQRKRDPRGIQVSDFPITAVLNLAEGLECHKFILGKPFGLENTLGCGTNKEDVALPEGPRS